MWPFTRTHTQFWHIHKYIDNISAYQICSQTYELHTYYKACVFQHEGSLRKKYYITFLFYYLYW